MENQARLIRLPEVMKKTGDLPPELDTSFS
ncbi:hypothetical protein KPTA6363_043630 [Klebsiella pneumoniae]|nr:hypothetical protein KPTA6363_043630 [Klebsiella pneumoniae]